MCISPAIKTACGALVLTLAFASVGVARAQDAATQPVASAEPVVAVDLLPEGQQVSDTVIQLAGWVVASRDSEGYPFAIMDKAAAQILVFGGDGRLRGAAPVLIGSATGDHIAPGIAGLALREIPGRDRTTPAGRFVGGFGPSTDAGRVLWVDYDSAISIHPTATGVPAEKRPERLASPSPDDNRVTHGCINVAPEFYEQILRSTFERGGVFYVLPDEATLAETFPEFAQSRAHAEPEDGAGARPDRQ
ncbi:L,D-transpeptidase [Lysobacter sp. A6]|uniref:L,D-transpeptidase n=1 Tax=Noviluteimonas lactosilytica TaxID=2888523 RepID=A0ABS8JEE1_9GAMM|nr:L,D-transpeptidase [Lysobacter lactosilyticus]MCC8361943.1 L,D-transpeptidase [Lysobacter lactosilyticus]